MWLLPGRTTHGQGTYTGADTAVPHFSSSVHGLHHSWAKLWCTTQLTAGCLCCSGINKPVAVLDWLQKVEVKEDYVLIIDADMIMRAPVIPADLGAEPGTVHWHQVQPPSLLASAYSRFQPPTLTLHAWLAWCRGSVIIYSVFA